MCDASDFAVGAVLGQRLDKKLNVIHYASKTLDAAQKNYATTEKECNIPLFVSHLRPSFNTLFWVN
jgi:hypothetical protein